MPNEIFAGLSGIRQSFRDAVRRAALGGRLQSVQIMRALAALSVVAGHSFHELPHFHQSDLGARLETLPLGMGVDLFFIISGFIMMTTSGQDFGRPGAAWQFLSRRIARVVPPYWFFTTMMIVAIFVLGNQLDTAVFTPEHALLSYLFVPHLTPGATHEIFPILQLGWTLLYEMFFYGMFALALRFPRRAGLAGLTLAFVLLFLIARFGGWSPAFNRFWGNSVLFEFLLGILLAIHFGEKGYNWRTILPLLLFGAVTIAAAIGLRMLWAERLFNAGFPSFFLFILLYGLGRARNPAFLALVLIGDASYTIYLSHPFTLQIAAEIIQHLMPAGGGPIWAVAYMATAFLLSIPCGIFFYILAEYPVTRWLARKLSGTTPRLALIP